MPFRLFVLLLTITAALPAQTNHVVVVSLDGFPAYALNNPAIPLPVLRKLIREGASADAMEPVNPSVTWPNHTTMVTGVPPSVHGVIYNGLPVRGAEGAAIRVEPWIEKDQLVQAPTVYDVVHDAGGTTAEVDWVAIHHAKTVNWSFAEVPDPAGKVEREMIDRGIATADQVRDFRKLPITERDDLWTQAAVHIIEQHRPTLLLLHLLTTDSVQHRYGARSLAADTALILADRQLQRILDALEHAGIRQDTTLLVVSDHGFETYQHHIRPNALFRQKGWLRDKEGAIDCDVWTVAEGGTAMIYVTRESRRAELLGAVKETFRGMPGVARVIEPSEYAGLGYPPVSKGGRMSDLVLAAAPGYAFDGASQGDVVAEVPAGAGAHGYLNSDPDMLAILVAWGAGIRPGARAAVVKNLDVAPTIAQLLGVRLPAARGSVIKNFLK